MSMHCCQLKTRNRKSERSENTQCKQWYKYCTRRMGTVMRTSGDGMAMAMTERKTRREERLKGCLYYDTCAA